MMGGSQSLQTSLSKADAKAQKVASKVKYLMDSEQCSKNHFEHHEKVKLIGQKQLVVKPNAQSTAKLLQRVAFTKWR